MYQFIKLFFDICLFKKGPQDIPYSDALFRLLILVYFAINFLTLALSTDQFNALTQGAVQVILVIALCWIILFVANKRARFLQTACALLATDSLISFISLPALATLVGVGSGLSFVVIVLLMLWHWVVTGHIFRHALAQSLIFSLGIAFMYILTLVQLMASLFPTEMITQ